jgi:hypothetical protein
MNEPEQERMNRTRLRLRSLRIAILDEETNHPNKG